MNCRVKYCTICKRIFGYDPLVLYVCPRRLCRCTGEKINYEIWKDIKELRVP